MKKAALAVVLVSSLMLVPGVATANLPPGWCELDPTSVECEGGGSGGGGSTTTTTTEPGTYHWGSWSRSTVDCSDGDPRYLRYLHWEDHTLVDPSELLGPPPEGSLLGDSYIYQRTCVEVQTVDLWESLASEIEALPILLPSTSPPVSGITGLETWFWHEGDPQVGPVTATWTDGPTGVTFDLQGVAWIGTITWDAGDGTVLRSDAVTYSSASSVGGNVDEPAVTHTYEQTSVDAGHEEGYLITTTITWLGEWRWRVSGGVWEPWRPMTNTVDVVSSRRFPVEQVVGQLEPTG